MSNTIRWRYSTDPGGDQIRYVTIDDNTDEYPTLKHGNIRNSHDPKYAIPIHLLCKPIEINIVFPKKEDISR